MEVFTLKQKLRIFMDYFTETELKLWFSSVGLILMAFFMFDRVNYLTLTASLIGVTSLIFNAKGNPFGQFLMIIFSILYGIISYRFAYYGEMATYLGMTAPMALVALVTWLKNPYDGKSLEVEVKRLSKEEFIRMLVFNALVTGIFYFILRALGTANIVPSTISVATSFFAVYLTYKRSAYYAIAYAANDIILIILWVLASIQDVSYLSVVICFAIFLINDCYGFINWNRMRAHQEKNPTFT